MRFLSVFFAAMVVLAGAASPARAAIEIDITRGHLNPMPVAAPDFIAAPGADPRIGQQISALIRSNLERSGLFRPVDQAAYIEKVADINVQPRFADWRIISAQALVVGQTTQLPDGRVRIEFRLWDVTAEQEVFGLQYATTPENWRRIAHKISDAIYERLTGEKGYFDTRVVFVAESGPKTRRVKRLAIMDQDGANPSYLTSGDYMVLTPRFSPTAQQITYMSYESGAPRVFLFNIETGRQEVLGQFPGMTFAPRFSPDGASVLLTMEQGGNSDVYRMDLRSRQRVRLTENPAIDTSPSGSPDGSQIVFNSDRGGSPQLYVMKSDGSDQKRISFGDGRYSTPVWSPRGDLIAFTKQSGGRFQIGVMRPDGSAERILSESYLDEGPTWSPNGRVVMFFREPRPGAGPSLFSVDLTGQNLRPAPTPTQASDPAWSPLLP
ncbi:MAG: Tol-Pal system beta propeller repeat protein TolB [Caulobacterales bacterium]|jgi:TolB protein